MQWQSQFAYNIMESLSCLVMVFTLFIHQVHLLIVGLLQCIITPKYKKSKTLKVITSYLLMYKTWTITTQKLSNTCNKSHYPGLTLKYLINQYPRNICTEYNHRFKVSYLSFEITIALLVDSEELWLALGLLVNDCLWHQLMSSCCDKGIFTERFIKQRPRRGASYKLTYTEQFSAFLNSSFLV